MNNLNTVELLLFKERLSVQIPKDFENMSIEVAKTVFPSEDRPQIIMSNQDCSKFCTFSLFENLKMMNQQVDYAIKTLRKVVIGLYPASLVQDTKTFLLKDGNCGWFEYQSQMDVGDIHNIMFLFSVDGAMLLGTTGCIFGHEEEMRMVMKSLEIKKKKFQVYGVKR